MSFALGFLMHARETLARFDAGSLERLADEVVALKARAGRLFVLGVGGSAANASHAVNDFRKLCGIEAYAPTDNVAELTARTNDDGWDSTFSEWLVTSRLGPRDLLFVLSVGGGDRERNLSPNLIRALELAAERNVPVTAVVGRREGEAARRARAVVVVESAAPELVTPLTEAFQALVLHYLVSHPELQVNSTAW